MAFEFKQVENSCSTYEQDLEKIRDGLLTNVQGLEAEVVLSALLIAGNNPDMELQEVIGEARREWDLHGATAVPCEGVTFEKVQKDLVSDLIPLSTYLACRKDYFWQLEKASEGVKAYYSNGFRRTERTIDQIIGIPAGTTHIYLE